MSRAVKSGRIDEAASHAALAHVEATLDLDDFADRDLIIEALPEIEQVKVDFFRQLDKIVAPDAILAANTSSIPVIRIANATSRPERVIGMHFFNPVPILPLVEVVVSLRTSEEVVEEVTSYAQNRLNKKTIRSGTGQASSLTSIFRAGDVPA